MTQEAFDKAMNNLNELMREAKEAIEALGPDRIDDIRYEIDMLDEMI